MDIELNSSTEKLGDEKTISSADEANTKENPSGGTLNRKSCNKRCKSRIQGYFHTLLSWVLLLAVIALTVVIILHSIKLNGRVQFLESKIESIEAAIEKNASILAESAALQAERHLESQIQATQASLASINASLSQFGAQLSATAASNISELRDHLQDLEASLANTSSSGCYEDRRFCVIRPVSENMYYRGCETSRISANIAVS